jgi:1-acyl-sn-glycerol-3-phosphate acyltransferase
MVGTTSTGKLYPVARGLLRPATKVVWPVETQGLENLPPEGGAIIAPNHISFLDSVVLIGVLPRRITYVGKAEYLDNWKTRFLFPAVGMIPIDRTGGKASAAALDTAARVLESGQLFGIFPEGTRSRDGLLYRGRTGIARLALRTGVPVVPVGIVGTDRIQPPGAAVPRPFRRCTVRFGEPIAVDRYAGRDGDGRVFRELTDEIMFEIAALSGQQYVDRYADRKAASDGGSGEAGGGTPAETAGLEPAAVQGATAVSGAAGA